nr:tail assembly protein [Pseudomonas fitomaticsae]
MAMAAGQEKMQTVLLSGSLARLFGRSHRMVTTGGMRDVIGYLKQLPGFERYMNESSKNGLKFTIFNGRRTISQEQLGDPTGGQVIRIVPVIAGSKRAGALQTIVGVALIALGYFTFGTTSTIGAAMISGGIGIAAGGVVQLLSPQTKGLASQDGPNNKASYSFNGPVNTSAQGNPVPVLYGEMIVGSAVISAGIYAEDQQ